MSAAQFFTSSELVGELMRRGQAEDVAARGGFESVAAMAAWAIEDDRGRQRR